MRTYLVACALLSLTLGWGLRAVQIREFLTVETRAVLPAYFDVTGLATASVACATLAAAGFLAAREVSRPRPVSVDSRAACAAIAAAGLFTPVGWSMPELWDPIAGNYRAADGWIRLHTNYPYHRAAVERVLGAGDRAAVAAAALRWTAADLEAGSLTISNDQSCISVQLQLVCQSP